MDMLKSLGSMGQPVPDSTAGADTYRTAYRVGQAAASTFLLIVWALAAVITGMLALLTRGKTVIVEDLPPASEVSFAKMKGPVPPDEFVRRAKASPTISPFAYVGLGFGVGPALIAGFAAVNWLIN